MRLRMEYDCFGFKRLDCLLNADDSQHARAEKFVKSIVGELIGIPEYVIVEVCNVVAAKAGQSSARAFLKALSENEYFSILFSSVEFYHSVNSLFIEREWSGLSFVDVALIHLSKNHEIITFDRKLQSFIRARSE